MDFGAHLPLMDVGGNRYRLDDLVAYTEAADRLGFAALAANDHLLFSVPWLDGPTALAAMIGHSGQMTLATTVALPVVRGPIPLAKSLAAIDRLSNGRLVVGVGPGSSAADYASVGVDFDQRWARFEESIGALRAVLARNGEPFAGRYYSTEGMQLAPRPIRDEGPPIWLGSWGSPTGLRRTARLADGWLASAYNTTPQLFAEAWSALRAQLPAHQKDPATFPNALSTMWFHITDSQAEADRVLRERIAPVVHRPLDVLRERLPVGPPERFAELLSAFGAAGVQRVFLWPVADELRQLDLFCERVLPLLEPP